MGSFFRKYKYHFFIVIFALAWISLFDYLIQMSSQGVMHSDSYNYQEAAKNLYIFHSGHVYRPILMSAISGIPYLFGCSDQAIFSFAFYVNLFCWLATFLLLFEIIKTFIKPRIALIFVFLAILVVGNTAHVFHLLTETLYQFFIVAAFYLINRYYKTKEFWHLSLAIALLLSVMLIKPGSKFLAIVITLYFAKEIIRNYKSKSIFFIYGSLLMIAVQCCGMKYQFGNFTISYIDSATYYNYIGSKAICIKNNVEWKQLNNPRADYLYAATAMEQKRIASQDLRQQLFHNKVGLIKAYISDVKDNTVSANSCIGEVKNKLGRSHFEFWRNLFFDISKWQNRFYTLFAVLLSVFFLLKTYRRIDIQTIVSFYILYIIVLSGISCGQGDRFDLVTFPFMFLLLAKFLSETKMLKRFSEPLQK